jgi:uncharacterized protein (DUF433 family)
VNMTIQMDPVPLRVDEHGAIRIGNSRVTLDVIIAEHKRGASPEENAEEYDTLELADVYTAIGYYLRHAGQVAVYCRGGNKKRLPCRRRLRTRA